MRYDFDFVKYQACGNDFVLKDEMDGPRTPDHDRGKLASRLCERRFWIGADGLLFVDRADHVDGHMRLFEPDGKEADMCGNGLRCVAAYLSRKLSKDQLDILTRDGVKRVVKNESLYRASMGPVRARFDDLKLFFSGSARSDQVPPRIDLDVLGRNLQGYFVNTGEPHLVIYTKDLLAEKVRELGEVISRDCSRFPRAVNVDFVEVTGPREVQVRTYERGVFDETLSCGTGATASAFVSLLLGKVEGGSVDVITRGGPISIDIGAGGSAHMTGPATEVYKGRLSVDV